MAVRLFSLAAALFVGILVARVVSDAFATVNAAMAVLL